MRKLILAAYSLLLTLPAFAGPRDYLAVLNRCGAPTLGDTTIYENNTVAGGRKLVKYLRGTLHFDRVGNDGWTFIYGEHEKQDRLSAEQMAAHMPCLTPALADSAAAAPLPVIKADQRLAFSAKYHAKLLLGLGLLLVVLVVGGVLLGRRRAKEEEEA